MEEIRGNGSAKRSLSISDEEDFHGFNLGEFLTLLTASSQAKLTLNNFSRTSRLTNHDSKYQENLHRLIFG
jgi:hypothetical protein